MVSKKVRKAIRRGHWTELVRTLLFIGFLAFIFLVELSTMEGLLDFNIPLLNFFPRW